MSLINDALKRASQRPAAAPSTAGLRPTEEEQRPNSFPVVTLFIALIPLLALGMWFLAKGLQLRQQPAPAPVEVVAARAPEPPPAAPAIIVSASPPPPVTPPAPPPPAFKLQGIYWRPTRPSAVVNGKTVYVGDRVESARVTAIDQEGVTITVNGESRTLLLP